MTYATEQDIVDRYGAAELLTVADRDGSGVADPNVVARGLSDADAEINTYLAARYPLPLSPVPDVVVRLACALALYHMSTGLVVTEEKRKRYEDAIKLLKLISSGDASLGIASPPPSTGGGVTIDSPDRLFTRKKLGGLF